MIIPAFNIISLLSIPLLAAGIYTYIYVFRSEKMADGGERKTVVVVGGGIGGSYLAKLLQDRANVVLIDPKEFLEIPYATLRSIVEPSFAKKSVISHTDYLPHGRIVVSKAVNITETEVVTEQGDHIKYDYLAISTGHIHSGALSRSDKLRNYEEENKKLKSSNSVLVVGGGPTGVELAAEIATDFPEKKVTLVSKGSRLLEFIAPKASKKALDWLVSKKVEVILGQSVDLDTATDGVYVTSGGETIKADCHFKCIGLPMASSWLKDTVLRESLDSKGRLMVDPKLRVKGFENVFAVGDITDIPELKQGYLAHMHAGVAAKNLKLLISGGDDRKMGTYKPAKPLALVSLGRNEGVAQILCLTMSGKIPGKIKSGDLFVGKTRKEYGLKANAED